MLITRETEYALRILRALSRGEQLPAAAVAQREHMSKAVTLKILKCLHAAGLVDSRRGPSGGYRLERPCEELYLWDLFCAMGDPFLVNRCQQPDYHCENRPQGECGLCRELTRIQGVLDAELRKTPLSVIFQEMDG
ncbi:Rrf2 family transcriptional regulator [Colidextribacter sp. OB.20]|uniref:RrF2 family transcriptional regulator n=1 Tax=Colidextribacter sp. OB.20 TaxID=2304568 RepID=UPI00136F176E|nr:Rrf2 family transcriptional regulator [Colidextribacter sp. OB.20]